MLACKAKNPDADTDGGPTVVNPDTQTETGATLTVADLEDACDPPPDLAPSWSALDDPCEALNGLVFQRPCYRKGFLNGRWWAYVTGGYEYGTVDDNGPYTCVVQDAQAVLACGEKTCYTIDMETGTLTDMFGMPWPLVGDDLEKNFLKWFPTSAEEFEEQGGYAGRRNDSCPPG